MPWYWAEWYQNNKNMFFFFFGIILGCFGKITYHAWVSCFGLCFSNILYICSSCVWIKMLTNIMLLDDLCFIFTSPENRRMSPKRETISKGKFIMPTIEKIRGISSLKQLGACCCYPPGTSHEQWKRSRLFTTKVYRRLYYPVIWGWSIINKPWNTDPLLNNQCFMESKAGFFGGSHGDC